MLSRARVAEREGPLCRPARAQARLELYPRMPPPFAKGRERRELVMPETDEEEAKPLRADADEELFFELLRAAAFVFETDPEGRFKGSILACRAVEQFIRVRGRGAELAGPFHPLRRRSCF